MTRTVLVFLLATAAWGQTAPAANWYGVGGAWNSTAPAGTSAASGWAAYGKLVSASAGLWSFTQYNAYLAKPTGGGKAQIVTSVSTGAAILVRQISFISVFAFGTVGLATEGGGAGGVFPYGGFVDFHLGKTLWHLNPGYQIIPGANLPTQKTVLLGIGRVF